MLTPPLVVAALVAGAMRFSQSHVVIRNLSEDRLDDLDVRLAGRPLWRGDLASEESVELQSKGGGELLIGTTGRDWEPVWIDPDRGGTVIVSLARDGRVISSEHRSIFGGW